MDLKGRPPKDRAALACLPCRARKVRCNVVVQHPCTNCRSFSTECKIKAKRRLKHESRRRHPGQKVRSSPESFRQVQNEIITTRATEEIRPSPAILMDHFPQLEVQPMHEGENQEQHNILDNLYWPDSTLEFELLDEELLFLTEGLTGKMVSGPDVIVNAPSEFSPTRDSFIQLPHFLQPLPASMSSEDIIYLRLKGALTIPDYELCNSSLQAFSDYIFPFMPILDIHILQERFRTDALFASPSGSISLLVFQAIVFATIPFIETGLLLKAGYASPREARMIHYKRTRVLYDFDYESDTISNIQALLLMTYWHETIDDEKDASHWMGLAKSLAEGLYLHQDSGPAVTSKQKLHRRIWWPCFMRDQLISLALRRSPHINFDDFTTRMLEEDDFDVYSPGVEPSVRQELTGLCISKAKLCICLNRVLRTCYELLPRRSVPAQQTTGSSMMLLPKPNVDFDTVFLIDQELLEWELSLPLCCKYMEEVPSIPSDGKSAIVAHKKLLHMVFQTTVLTLHRPHCDMSPSSFEASLDQELSWHKVNHAAKAIGKLVTELQSLQVKQFLPSVIVTAIIPAMVVMLKDMQDNTFADPTDTEQYFDGCLELLGELSQVYAVADEAMTIVRLAMRAVKREGGQLAAS
ncbi:cutinase transcription factor 1 beta [Fusarium albosuccineum]|uniref:Cutinase transcription factor 1 beta n=1 Tax=Fusarium albosuccineum TaxID=1237068 RepID=A0A8H4PB76_9HYPO|nr:cutinase transcription factor 1 beta [Fusarium albosuccineum]